MAIRHEQDHPSVEPVGDDPRRNRQEHVWQQADGTERADERGVAGFAVDHDEDRDDVQPVAEPADHLADQQPHQWPVPEQLSVDTKTRHA
jgi:hypothetical protein